MQWNKLDWRVLHAKYVLKPEVENYPLRERTVPHAESWRHSIGRKKGEG